MKKITINGIEVEVPAKELEVAEGKTLALNLNDLIVKTKTDYETFISNTSKERYEAGREKGEKEAVLQAMEKHGIDLTDTKKTIENFIQKFSSKIESEVKVEPEEKLKNALTEKEKALQIAQSWEGKYNELSNMMKEGEKKAKINSLILEATPKNITTKIPMTDIVSLYNINRTIKITDDNSVEIFKGGIKLQNPNNLNNITIQEDFTDFVKGYIEIQGGNKENDRTGDKGSLSAFQKEMQEKGITGAKFNEEMQKRIKSGTLVI